MVQDVISCPFQQTEAMPPKAVEPTNPTDQLSSSTSREQLSEAAQKQVGAVALWELMKSASDEDAPKQVSSLSVWELLMSKTAPEQVGAAAPEQLSMTAPEQLSRAAPEQLREAAPEQLREAALESDEGPNNAGSTPCTADDIQGSMQRHVRILTDSHKSLSGNNNSSSPRKLLGEQPISSTLKRKASVIDLTKCPKPVSKCKYVPAVEVIDLTVDEPNVPLAAIPKVQGS